MRLIPLILLMCFPILIAAATNEPKRTFFYEVEKGHWIQINNCNRIRAFQNWGEPFYRIEFSFQNGKQYSPATHCTSLEETRNFLQEEIFDKLK